MMQHSRIALPEVRTVRKEPALRALRDAFLRLLGSLERFFPQPPPGKEELPLDWYRHPPF
jgi:hypothetical protein